MKILAEEALKLGVPLSARQQDSFKVYREMLIDFNQRFNLTAIDDPEEVVRKHFVDSLSALKILGSKGKCIDVGTGAGFPGLPLAIACPGLQVVLLDSLDKRVRFLKEVIVALKLDDQVHAIHARAEDVGQSREHREVYDYAISRAVARLNLLAEFCLPLVRVGGCFVAMKGPSASGEIEEARRAVAVLGGGSINPLAWRLPGEVEEERVLVTVDKVKSTPQVYPRRAGTPAKKPLV